MSEYAGELWVAVRPETSGFGPALATDIGRASTVAGARAGRDAGRAAGAEFSRSFREYVKTAAAVTGVVGVFEVVREAIHEGAAQAGEIALLDQALTNAGQSSRLFGSDISDLIQKQAVERGFIDDELYPAYTRLLRATDSTAKSYRLLGDAEDIARQRHVEVGIAALALAKFEQGSATALQRLGVILPQHIRDLKGARQETEGLAFIEKQFAGSADAFAKSGEGALQRIASARRQVSEAAGTALLPELENLADWAVRFANNEENLERVENDVAQGARLVEGALKAVVTTFEVADRAITPVVDALGGVDKAAELVFGALAVRKVQTLALGAAAWAKTVTTGETAVAAAASAEAAATTAATVASERQIIVYGARGEVLTTVAVAEDAAAAATSRAGAAAGIAGPKFFSAGLSAKGLGGVLKSGVAPAAVLAGYELSKLIRDFPGWESAFEALGSKAEQLAEKLNLIKGGGISSASARAAGTLSDPAVQAQLAAAYKEAAKVTGSSDFAKEVRDKVVAAIVGPGYTFADAKAFFEQQKRSDASFAAGTRGIGSRQNYDAADAARARAGRRPTDTDYQIQVQEALATQSTADEEALYRQRVSYLDKRIAAMKRVVNLTADEKKNLLRLEQERASTQDAIDQIDKQAADDAKQRAEKAQREYSDTVQVAAQTLALNTQRAQLTQATLTDDLNAAKAQLAFDRREAADMKLTAEERRQYAAAAVSDQQSIQSINEQIHAKEREAYRSALSLTEQRLRLAAQRAQLTESSIEDDKKAARKLIAFYKRESHDMKLTEQERLQYASQAIEEQIALKSLTGQQQGATVEDIFREAASEYHNFGSNIAARNGVLSGQDERANFSRLLLESHAVGRTADDARFQSTITELRTQTGLLTRIADHLAPPPGQRNRNRPPTLYSENAFGQSRVRR